jgi:hypothetical protein
VEAWVDGRWYFMGACEPEPVLNLGWFNAAASRGMLMHTKVFGFYDGPEEVMEHTACYTEINVIDHYAPTATASVTVRNVDGQPVEDALVEFKVYNYAEFYSVAKKKTGKDGRCSLSAGKGDMLVWATKDGGFGYGKLSFGKDAEAVIVLDKKPGYTGFAELDITPPAEGSTPVDVTREQKEANEKLMRREDSIRNGYVSTFYTEETAQCAITRDACKTLAAGILVKSRGNHAQIEKFLKETPDSLAPRALSLLRAVSDKDLRDTPAKVFFDHLNNLPPTAGCKDSSILQKYVLNPRVSNELITAYKKFFRENIDPSLSEAARRNPQALVSWVKDNIGVRDDLNPQRIPVMPAGVWKARIADRHSRNIFFVAVARSLGIPARIESVTKKVQYCFDGRWTDVNFDADGEPATAAQGHVVATYHPIPSLDNPKYYSHFTLSKLLPDARLQTLNFDSRSRTDMGDGDTWKELFLHPLAIDEGHYMLTTGTRMASGKVLARITFFSVEKDRTSAVTLTMRDSRDDIQVIGNINAEAKFHTAGNGEETSLLNTAGRGYFIIGILGPRQEPTNHAMRDIGKHREDLEKWNRSIILLFKSEESLTMFDKNEFGALPATISLGIDTNGGIMQMITENMKLSDPGALPVFVIADTFGRVVFVSQGYTIGLGEQLMNVISKL